MDEKEKSNIEKLRIWELLGGRRRRKRENYVRRGDSFHKFLSLSSTGLGRDCQQAPQNSVRVVHGDAEKGREGGKTTE